MLHMHDVHVVWRRFILVGWFHEESPRMYCAKSIDERYTSLILKHRHVQCRHHAAAESLLALQCPQHLHEEKEERHSHQLDSSASSGRAKRRLKLLRRRSLYITLPPESSFVMKRPVQVCWVHRRRSCEERHERHPFFSVCLRACLCVPCLSFVRVCRIYSSLSLRLYMYAMYCMRVVAAAFLSFFPH